jgi:hypothetical protein
MKMAGGGKDQRPITDRKRPAGLGAPSDQIVLSGNGSLNISPMSTGLYQGISIFQDRNSTAKVDISANGCINGATTSVSGTVYAAKALVYVQGNSGLAGSQIVAGTITTTANGSLTISLRVPLPGRGSLARWNRPRAAVTHPRNGRRVRLDVMPSQPRTKSAPSSQYNGSLSSNR